jgi:murein peptide amidase A
LKSFHHAIPHPDRVRDYRLLLERWLKVCGRQSGLTIGIFAEADSYPLMVVESASLVPGNPTLYLSTGIHGDEPAPVEALIQWAEENKGDLAKFNLLIFPCLNPWGLERNIRFDAEGRDLNRCYNSRKLPRITAQLQLMKGRRFEVAACLHEDYDARGFYLYEIAAARPHFGEKICGELSRIMPADNRSMIDGHTARGGLIRRKIRPDMLSGHPEAFRLHFHHADRTFTLETPSEERLVDRISLQSGFLRFLAKKAQTRDGKYRGKS